MNTIVMRHNGIFLIIIACFIVINHSSVYAEEFTLRSTIRKDLAILERDGHGRDFFVVGTSNGYRRVNKMNFKELKTFEEIAALDLSGFIKEEMSIGNLRIKQWTLNSMGIRSIRELTYSEPLKKNLIRIKQYIIEKERRPYTLRYLSVDNQGLISLQQDEEKIYVVYEIVLADLQEGLVRFEKAVKAWREKSP